MTDLVSFFKSPSSLLVLTAALFVAAGIVFLIRAWQAWQYRQAYGYSVYRADSTRKRLTRWARATLGIGAAVAVLYGAWLGLGSGQTPIDLLTGGDSPAEVDPLAGMKLVIPRLAVEAALIEAPFVARQWDVSFLRGEVAHLEGTAYPGQPGNAVLAGHITIPGAGWGPFQELALLQPGDHVFILQGDHTFKYEVQENVIVDQGDVHVAFPTDDTRLTLLTCTGWDTIQEIYLQRVAIIALFIPEGTASQP